MSQELSLGLLAHGPHAALIRALAERCYADPTVQAIWVGGSLAAGQGDRYSDIDFRIAVEPGALTTWQRPDWKRYLPLDVCCATFLQFGEHALLHHLVLVEGTIVDFYVQDTLRENPEPALVIVACRNKDFGKALATFAQPARTLARPVDSERARQFLVDYWIVTHKEAKGLGRRHDYFAFVGLYFERIALLRAWYMEATGKAIDARVTIHVIGALQKGLEGKLSAQQENLLGLPTRTPAETALVIEGIREEMSRVGKRLAQRHAFAYPQALEDTVLKTWNAQKAALLER